MCPGLYTHTKAALHSSVNTSFHIKIMANMNLDFPQPSNVYWCCVVMWSGYTLHSLCQHEYWTVVWLYDGLFYHCDVIAIQQNLIQFGDPSSLWSDFTVTWQEAEVRFDSAGLKQNRSLRKHLKTNSSKHTTIFVFSVCTWAAARVHVSLMSTSEKLTTHLAPAHWCWMRETHIWEAAGRMCSE